MDKWEQTIYEVTKDIALRHGLELSDLTRDQNLVEELRFESLDYAELVAVLEVKLGVDPFAKDTSIADIRTVGDLCDAYRRHVEVDTST